MYAKYRALKLRLCEILIQKGLITEGQLDKALRFQKERGGRIGETLIRLGMVSEEEIASTLASQINIPYLSLENLCVDETVIDLVSKDFASRVQVFPICLTGKVLTLAMADPLDFQSIAELEQETGLTVEAVVAMSSSIRESIKRYYDIDNAQSEWRRVQKASHDTPEHKRARERVEALNKMQLAEGDRRGSERAGGSRKKPDSVVNLETSLQKKQTEKEALESKIDKISVKKKAAIEKTQQLTKELEGVRKGLEETQALLTRSHKTQEKPVNMPTYQKPRLVLSAGAAAALPRHHAGSFVQGRLPWLVSLFFYAAFYMVGVLYLIFR